MKKLPLIIRCSRDIHSSWPASSSFAAYQVSKSHKCTNWVGITCFRLQLAQPISPHYYKLVWMFKFIQWGKCGECGEWRSRKYLLSFYFWGEADVSQGSSSARFQTFLHRISKKPSFTGLAKNLPSQDYWTFLQGICKSHQVIWGLGVSEWKWVSCIFCWVYITTI